MKILQINKFYYLRGGSERYLFALSDLLAQKGHQVIPFSMADDNNFPSKYSEYFIRKVDLEKFSLRDIFKFFYNPDAVRRLEKLIEKEKPDLAHLHNIAHQFSPAIIKVLKKRKIPIVQTLHDYKLICPNAMLFSQGAYCEKCRGKKYYQCLANKCMKNSRAKSLIGMLEAYIWSKGLDVYADVDLFLSPSGYLKEKCVLFGIPEEKIKVLPNFLDQAPAKKSGAPSAEEYILYYGRLSREKGIDTLLRAFGQIKSRVELKIVGAGPDYKRLEQEIARLGLGERAFLLGPKYNDDLERLVDGAKAVVLPSIWPENMPYCLMESMAKGKAAVVSNIGGMPELIKDRENGFLFPAGDDSALAQTIDDLEKYDLEKIGANAQKTIKSYGPESHWQELKNLYRLARKGA